MIKLVTATWGSLTISAEEDEKQHPNSMKFEGVLLQLDEASTKPPNGAKGHRILVPKIVAQKRLDTLLGMGVNLSSEKDGHAPQRKVGVINKAWIKGSQLWISGQIWKKDFPDAEKALNSKKLGMSFEGSEVQIEDQNAHIWSVKDLVFTGAALLLKTAAAYYKTEALAASAMFAELVDIGKGGKVMAKEKGSASPGGLDTEALGKVFAAAISNAVAPLAAAVNAQTAAITSMHASIETSNTDMLELIAGKASDDDEDEDEVQAARKKKSDSNDDDDDDDDDDEDDDDDDVESSKMEACSCGGKGCDKCKKGMKAKGSDDEGEFEELDEADDDEKPGKMNKGATKEKGDKTTVTASGSVVKLRKLVTTLMAQNEKLLNTIKAERKKNKTFQAAAEKAAERISRKSVATGGLKLSAAAVAASKPSSLLLGLMDKFEMAAGAEDKKTMSEFNEFLNASGITDPTQRIALKSEAERIGIVYTAGESQK